MSQSINQDFKFLSLLKFALPSMLMMMFLSCYTIVDGIFISRFVGSNALSAVNIVYPMYNILFAFGIMLATGGSAVVAKKLGEGNAKKAREDFTFLVLTGFLISVCLSALVCLFTAQISKLLGASALLLPDCNAYLRTLYLFAPLAMLQELFQAFFIAAGKPHLGLILTIFAGLANAMLDYLFLGVLHFGVEGAALATGIGQSIPALVGLVFFLRKKGTLFFVPFSPDLVSLRQASSNGASEMVTNLSNGIITYLFNIILMRLAGENGVAAITILLYAQFLFNALYLGFSMGVAPLLSFQYGAKDGAKLKKLYQLSKRFVCISSVAITLFSFLFSKNIAAVFVEKGSETYALASSGFSIFCFGFLFSGYNIYSSALFTALSDGKTSAALSFTRTFALITFFLFTLPYLFGIHGVWLAIPVAEACSIFLSIFFQRRKLGRIWALSADCYT